MGIRAWLMMRVGRTAVVLSAVGMAGCGDGRLPVYPVSGTVTLDGKPLAKAEIWLVPKGETALKAEPVIRPYAVADSDGNFAPSTYLTSDGAPAGEYGVMVHWAGAPVSSDNQDEQPEHAANGKGERPLRFPRRYMNPTNSGLTVTIREEPNRLALDLKSK
jgi:hypothetical protein